MLLVDAGDDPQGTQEVDEDKVNLNLGVHKRERTQGVPDLSL